MNKVLLDSNIIIGLAKNHLPIAILQNYNSVVFEITRLEVFGYHKIQKEEEKFLGQFFLNISFVDISRPLIDKAIELRQRKAMSLGDAIIAATAITENLPLITLNHKDFKNIRELILIPRGQFEN